MDSAHSHPHSHPPAHHDHDRHELSDGHSHSHSHAPVSSDSSPSSTSSIPPSEHKHGHHHGDGHGQHPGHKHCQGHGGKGEHGHHHHHHHHAKEMPTFEDAEKWAKLFEEETRMDYGKPTEVLQALGILASSPSSSSSSSTSSSSSSASSSSASTVLPPLAPLPLDFCVADIGAGTGFYPSRVAKALDSEGVTHSRKVYCVDIQPNMIKYLSDRALKENISHILTPILAPSESDWGLPGPVDIIMSVNVYHHFENRVALFTSMKKYLKPGAKFVVIDWRLGQPMGPPEWLKVSEDAIVTELASAGYTLTEKHEFMPHQCFMVFQAQ